MRNLLTMLLPYSLLQILACLSMLPGARGGSLFARTAQSPSQEEAEKMCTTLAMPWTEARLQGGHWGHIYRLKVLNMGEGGPKRAVFPEQSLFRFVRRVYHCCQMGFHCGGVKGLQGREAGGSSIEFRLSEDVLSAPVVRAEIHLQVSNPQHLNIQPLLPSLEKRQLPTRYAAWSKDGVSELRVDLTFLFQALQRALGSGRGGPSLLDIRRVGGLSRPWASDSRDKGFHDPILAVLGEGHGDGWLERSLQSAAELGLALHCSTTETNTQPCQNHRVRLLHTPFITLSYR
uniref:Si:ch211-170d8.2 n=1 Tax=Astyanax mexicanus TaxID=7994 RepID=A0A3B1K8K5_ASTMX